MKYKGILILFLVCNFFAAIVYWDKSKPYYSFKSVFSLTNLNQRQNAVVKEYMASVVSSLGPRAGVPAVVISSSVYRERLHLMIVATSESAAIQLREKALMDLESAINQSRSGEIESSVSKEVILEEMIGRLSAQTLNGVTNGLAKVDKLILDGLTSLLELEVAKIKHLKSASISASLWVQESSWGGSHLHKVRAIILAAAFQLILVLGLAHIVSSQKK